MINIKKESILKFLKYALSITLSLTIFVIVAGGLLFLFYISSAPKLSEKQLKATNLSMVYDSENNLIGELGSENRESVTADNIPLDLVNAITSIEDHRYFKHRGIDIFRIASSALHNLTSSTTQGGSTLDQQLIKLTYFSTSEEDQTLKRKAQEAWLALQLERKYTKQEILTYYINKVYMANGTYGMLTAAKEYYHKDLKDLSIAQLALLAGMPQAPNQYDPYTNPDAAKARRDTVLQRMYEFEHITEEEYKTAINTPVTDGLQELVQESSYPAYMDNYLKQVIEEVQEQTGADIFKSGMKVYTNVNSEAQQQLYNIFNTYDYVAYPNDSLQAASTVIDVTNGKVIAQLGTRNQDESVSFGTNQAVLTDRDWGSSMKPISAYAPAIDYGAYSSTGQLLNDSYYTWPGTDIQLFDWDRQYNGWMSMQTAIQQSRNVPAARALEAAGLDNALAFLNKLGINYPEMVYANAISSNTSSTDSQYGASSEKMAAAYAAFSNGGIYYKPQYVNKIEFNDGSVKTYDPVGNRAMKETTAYMMTDMMKTVLSYGIGTNAAISGVFQAGKTGTSNYTDDELVQIAYDTGISTDSVGTIAPDESFVGYTPQYSMAVWTGYKNRLTPLYGDQLDLATDIYRSMMTYLNPYGNSDWTMPDGLYRSGGYLFLDGASTRNTAVADTSNATAASRNATYTSQSIENDDEEDTTTVTSSTLTTDSSSAVSSTEEQTTASSQTNTTPSSSANGTQ